METYSIVSSQLNSMTFTFRTEHTWRDLPIENIVMGSLLLFFSNSRRNLSSICSVYNSSIFLCEINWIIYIYVNMYNNKYGQYLFDGFVKKTNKCKISFPYLMVFNKKSYQSSPSIPEMGYFNINFWFWLKNFHH